MKKVSIITVNLNNKVGLIKTAHSVVNQTAFSDIEWIVIDGGSTDGSLAVLDEFCNKMAYFVSELDYGIYNAMNKGIKEAHGEYLLFINSGDYLKAETTIEQFLASPEYGKYDYCVGIMEKELNGIITGKVIPHESISALGLMTKAVSHQAEFIKRDRFSKIQYDETYKIMADFKFTFNDLVYYNASYAPLNFIVSVFDSDGISSHITDTFNDEVRRCFADVLPKAIHTDYIRWMKEGTLLERIMRMLPSNGFEISTLTAFACVCFLPRWCSHKLKLLFKQKR